MVTVPDTQLQKHLAVCCSKLTNTRYTVSIFYLTSKQINILISTVSHFFCTCAQREEYGSSLSDIKSQNELITIWILDNSMSSYWIALPFQYGQNGPVFRNNGDQNDGHSKSWTILAWPAMKLSDFSSLSSLPRIQYKYLVSQQNYSNSHDQFVN